MVAGGTDDCGMIAERLARGHEQPCSRLRLLNWKGAHDMVLADIIRKSETERFGINADTECSTLEA